MYIVFKILTLFQQFLNIEIKILCLVKLREKYLGIDISLMNKESKFFQPVIDKMESTASLWKTKLLGQGGKLTLIKAVLSSVPIYQQSCFKAPKSTSDQMNQIMRIFFVG